MCITLSFVQTEDRIIAKPGVDSHATLMQLGGVAERAEAIPWLAPAWPMYPLMELRALHPDPHSGNEHPPDWFSRRHLREAEQFAEGILGTPESFLDYWREGGISDERIERAVLSSTGKDVLLGTEREWQGQTLSMAHDMLRWLGMAHRGGEVRWPSEIIFSRMGHRELDRLYTHGIYGSMGPDGSRRGLRLERPQPAWYKAGLTIPHFGNYQGSWERWTHQLDRSMSNPRGPGCLDALYAVHEGFWRPNDLFPLPVIECKRMEGHNTLDGNSLCSVWSSGWEDRPHYYTVGGPSTNDFQERIEAERVDLSLGQTLIVWDYYTHKKPEVVDDLEVLGMGNEVVLRWKGEASETQAADFDTVFVDPANRIADWQEPKSVRADLSNPWFERAA